MLVYVKELGAEAEETGNVDYVWNARELYRVFLRSGGAPHRKNATAFDRIGNEKMAGAEIKLLLICRWKWYAVSGRSNCSFHVREK